MKKLIISVFGLVTGLVASASTLDGGVSIVFSSKGPDKYADGSVVMDGECYALVYTENDKFGGLKCDGTPVVTGDKVALVAPLAANGGCPTVTFRLTPEEYAADYKSSGKFAVILVDTRKFDADGNATVAGAPNGALTFANATEAVTAEVAISVNLPTSFEASLATGANAATSVLPENTPQPKITNISVLGDKVVLKVENTVNYINYAVEGGTEVGSTEVTSAKQTGNGTIYMVVPKQGERGFFKVNRK